MLLFFLCLIFNKRRNSDNLCITFYVSMLINNQLLSMSFIKYIFVNKNKMSIIAAS